ncbi:MAG TPA: DUF4430 domain-containing protein [Solirubrobacteraceae bacterium]|nr:DUF4430 domain-containing protein [Solirubrobacteraceae bacterium]
MRRRTLGLAAVVLALSAAPAGAATVSVRVEGTTQTLVPRTSVSTPASTPTKDGNPAHGCAGNTVAGALEVASAGNWAGTWSDSFTDYLVSAIGGEDPSAADANNFWSLWVNNKEAQQGVCQTTLQQGDEVLFFVARCEFNGTACANAPVVPLGLTVPARTAPGAPFTVRVVQYAADGTPSPASGATVSAAAASATTGADGTATLTLTARGPVQLRATKSGLARSATEFVCVTDGSDGACGSTTPAPSAACATTGDDGNCGTKDRRAPRGKILSIREGQRFKKGKGPRGLSGIVTADPSGIADIRLRLTRNERTHCSTYDGRRERFAAMKRCGAKRGKWFSVGDREQWSYLLPSRLGPGRYVLDVQARDRAGNVDTLLQRTRTRVVFTVS